MSNKNVYRNQYFCSSAWILMYCLSFLRLKAITCSTLHLLLPLWFQIINTSSIPRFKLAQSPNMTSIFVEDSIIVRFVLHPGIDQMKAN